jgi:hypothetical protein
MANKQDFGGFGNGALLILVLFLVTVNLESVPPVWWDEGWNFTIARNWVESGYYGRLLVGAQVPISPTNGFPVIAPVALGFKLFGIGIWQGRVLFAVFSLGVLTLIYHLSTRLYGRDAGRGTLFVLILMAAYPGLHPILMGRQALGEIPAMFYLLLGYVFFLMAEKRTLWVIAVVLFWAMALVTKLQILPFWLVSMLAPLAVSVYAKSWRVMGLIIFGLIGAVVTSRLLLWLLELVLENPTLPNAQIKGLYQVTALVTAIPARLFALIVTLEFGMPTLLGISYGLWRYLRSRDKVAIDAHAEVVKLALLVLASSWFAWYVTLSVGWIRYLFPATLVGSIFVAAMCYDLTNGFNLAVTIRQSGSVFSEFRFTRKNMGALLVVVLVATTVPRSLTMLYKAYFLDADVSAQEVAHFINTQTPPKALIETYDSELFFLLQRPYHYPPDQLHVDLVRRTFLYDDGVSISYDPLAANPDYLVVGPHSKQWHLYDPVLNTGAFRLRHAYNRYNIYERVR